MTIYVSPFSRRARRMMERMMQDADYENQTENQVWFPVDIKVENEAFELTALLPGLSPEDLNIQVVNETVTISGEIKERRDTKANYLLAEIPNGYFSRTFTLPLPLDANGADANYENGLLTLRVPKAEAARPRMIKVQAKA